MGEAGLAEARRPIQKDVRDLPVEVASRLGGNAECLDHAFLAREVRQAGGS